MDSIVRGKPTPPSLRNIAQHGGTYQQVLDYGEYMLGVRTGGVEVLLKSSGQWKSVSHLPLSSIPVLYENEHGLFARFRTRLLNLKVDTEYQIHVLSEGGVPTNSPNPVVLAKMIKLNSTLFSISSANKGLRIQKDDGNESTCLLPGYSRPSSLALSRDERELLVADVGAIHSINIADKSLSVSSRLFSPGWPKDIAYDEGNVYCANVLGIRWYRETAEYPFLEQIDKLAHFHFRMAKVIAHKGRIVTCDEVRGLHFFSTADCKLQPRGGLMLNGGAWDCAVFDGQLLVSTGDEGWITAPFDWSTLKAGQPIRRTSIGRVHSVVPWPDAHSFVILSNKGVSVSPIEPMSNTDDYVVVLTDVSAWGAITIGEYLLIAAAKNGLYLLTHDNSNHIKVCCHFDSVEARDICFDGRYVWVADGKGGIRCYTFNTIDNILTFEGLFPIAGFSRGVMSTGKRVYVGAGDGGLVILDVGGD